MRILSHPIPLQAGACLPQVYNTNNSCAFRLRDSSLALPGFWAVTQKNFFISAPSVWKTSRRQRCKHRHEERNGHCGAALFSAVKSLPLLFPCHAQGPDPVSFYPEHPNVPSHHLHCLFLVLQEPGCSLVLLCHDQGPQCLPFPLKHCLKESPEVTVL